MDTTYSPVPPPENQAAAKHRPLGDHLLELLIEVIGNILPGAKASDYGFRVYWGIMPQGDASVEVATVPKRELMKATSGGEERPFFRFSRRKREVFDFAESDRDKTVSFCIRLENPKGQVGPWGRCSARLFRDAVSCLADCRGAVRIASTKTVQP